MNRILMNKPWKSQFTTIFIWCCWVQSASPSESQKLEMLRLLPSPLFSGTSRSPGKSPKKSINLAKSSYFTSLDFPSQRATFWGAQVGSWPSRGTGPGGCDVCLSVGRLRVNQKTLRFQKNFRIPSLEETHPNKSETFPLSIWTWLGATPDPNSLKRAPKTTKPKPPKFLHPAHS